MQHMSDSEGGQQGQKKHGDKQGPLPSDILLKGTEQDARGDKKGKDRKRCGPRTFPRPV